jgi:ABC-2 type transport system ATP-binding protein
MLRVLDVTKRFGERIAVDSLELIAEPGKIYGLIGPNGAGKSTTIRMILNILQPDSGSIEFDGRRLSAGDRDRFGYLPEERGLYRKRGLNEVLLYLASLKGCPPRVARKRIDAWLERLGLSEWKYRRVETLSKGMAQKAQFIAAVAHDPDILILDEPFSGLDPVSADELLAVIHDMTGLGKLVLLSTHAMEQAERVCDHIFMLDGGKKILDGDLRSIRRDYGANTVSIRFAAPTVSGAPGERRAPVTPEALSPSVPSQFGNVPAELFLAALPSVASVRKDGASCVVSLATGASSDDLFAALAGKARVESFAAGELSLREIFVGLVRGKESRDA